MEVKPEVRKDPARKALPFTVLLILDNAPGHPESHELHTKGVKMIYLSPNTVSLIQALDRGVMRTSKARYIRCSVERTVNARGENPDREDHGSLERSHH